MDSPISTKDKNREKKNPSKFEMIELQRARHTHMSRVASRRKYFAHENNPFNLHRDGARAYGSCGCVFIPLALALQMNYAPATVCEIYERNSSPLARPVMHCWCRCFAGAECIPFLRAKFPFSLDRIKSVMFLNTPSPKHHAPAPAASQSTTYCRRRSHFCLYIL